jgi:hypothetical protein
VNNRDYNWDTEDNQDNTGKTGELMIHQKVLLDGFRFVALTTLTARTVRLLSRRPNGRGSASADMREDAESVEHRLGKGRPAGEHDDPVGVKLPPAFFVRPRRAEPEHTPDYPRRDDPLEDRARHDHLLPAVGDPCLQNGAHKVGKRAFPSAPPDIFRVSYSTRHLILITGSGVYRLKDSA